MKIYKTKRGIIIEKKSEFYLSSATNWDDYVNDDGLYAKIQNEIRELRPDASLQHIIEDYPEPPVSNQEIWACGVTYIRSKVGREEESKDSGASTFYTRVYEAERPEIFFKATASRAKGHKEMVSIRRDSSWDVPEPELTLVVTSSGNIVGYTIGNDMSSRSIEGENPLYLPQAKMYDGSAAVGPCIFVTDQPLPKDTLISMQVSRNEAVVFEGRVAISQIRREFSELVSWLYREMSFPYGCLVMTGTGIVPSNDFTLNEGDVITISIPPIGTLINTVKVKSEK